MSNKTRALALADVGQLATLVADSTDPGVLYRALARIGQETIGWRLFTILTYVESAGAVERVYSSDETAYPVAGRKPLDKIAVSHAALAAGEVFLAGNRQEVRAAFFDHALIFSLGISAILNVPIRHAGRRLGTLNFCGEEGMYGAAEIAAGKVLAALLVGSLLELA